MGDVVTSEVDRRHLGSGGADLPQLRTWHQEYVAAEGEYLKPNSDVVRAVESDVLDHGQIEEQVQQLMLSTEVDRGFCAECRYQLEHWPDLGPKSWAFGVGRPLHSLEMEAATRAGCKFCAFLLSRLKAGGLLDSLRKIERRLQIIDDGSKSSISIQNWGSVDGKVGSQLIWFNLPGKVAKHCNSYGAGIGESETHVLTPSGKQQPPFWIRAPADNTLKRTCGRKLLTRSSW